MPSSTSTNWELVLVDDGSPDGSGAICDRYAAEHENITVIHQENGGVSVARNIGIEYALKHGDLENNWINFIDSDDFVHPKYLEYLYRAAKEAGTKISCCGFVRTSSSRICQDDDKAFRWDCLAPEDYWCEKFTSPIVAWGKLYRLCCFKGIRYPVGKIYEDDFTTYRILFHSTHIAITYSRLYFWYINPHSITMGGWSPAYQDAIEAVEEQIAFFEKNRYRRAHKKATTEYYKRALNHAYCIKEQSPKHDYLLDEAKAKKVQAFRTCLKTAGPGAALYAWLVPTIMSHKKLRRMAKTFYAWHRHRKK